MVLTFQFTNIIRKENAYSQLVGQRRLIIFSGSKLGAITILGRCKSLEIPETGNKHIEERKATDTLCFKGLRGFL